jgi:hypothetical protein
MTDMTQRFVAALHELHQNREVGTGDLGPALTTMR